MIVIAVDDERLMLKALTDAVSASPDIQAVHAFSSCSAALEWAAGNQLDAAFLDIHMRGMGGLALAERLTELHPSCKIIFCTGHDEYALEAIQLRCSGYLMKPITREAVQKEIDYILQQKAAKLSNGRPEKILEIRCFGHFEVFHNGQPLSFGRSKTRELLAVLVDRNGAGMTGRQICAVMWPDDTDDSRNMDYLRHLVSDLRSTLKSIDATEIFQYDKYHYRIDTERIQCDYLDYLKTGKPEFMGEYMTQYSWAEATCAMLTHI